MFTSDCLADGGVLFNVITQIKIETAKSEISRTLPTILRQVTTVMTTVWPHTQYRNCHVDVAVRIFDMAQYIAEHEMFSSWDEKMRSESSNTVADSIF